MSAPPPPYSEKTTLQYETTPIYPPQHQVDSAVYVQPHAVYVQAFRNVPVRMHCQYCQAEIVTSTYTDNGTLTWIACFIIFLFFPLGCCLIPFCMDSMKDVVHRCPNCKQQVGRWNRM
ncbi:hypothetical protein DPMN_180024 [Dreissena polymorpha]|uniref:LITAF domain-containing protein n=2 Tax=Dreissena polymorpha TaxID=45954 RepID=A0A9D4EDY0_DREPO|nr:hypothetical protein DPMN_180024 [Dreissena polymorpha]